ncbi:hypothetical protein B0T20DRAFT_415492 [Sordaria brevicollis]|uniref:Uncharacterized protein n=1 Tax=Sordaria brevicollis TaxID=83679 RepID=A0AAE0UAP5_SORBR|nr:hypothetical protein B0T20DRAFT_415492 [Sordaria brevicollis]
MKSCRCPNKQITDTILHGRQTLKTMRFSYPSYVLPFIFVLLVPTSCFSYLVLHMYLHVPLFCGTTKHTHAHTRTHTHSSQQGLRFASPLPQYIYLPYHKLTPFPLINPAQLGRTLDLDKCSGATGGRRSGGGGGGGREVKHERCYDARGVS